MANDNRFKVKNGLSTQNIEFVSADENTTLDVELRNSGTLLFNGQVEINERVNIQRDSSGPTLEVKSASDAGQDVLITVQSARNDTQDTPISRMQFRNYDDQKSDSNIMGMIAGEISDITNNLGRIGLYYSSDGSALIKGASLETDGEFKIVNSLDVGENLTLGAVNAQISTTAVDVFIYDTTKDSDGGMWRHNTQGTSWYQEALNTSTRGATRKFPSVAVIIIETLKITIYDGDKSDMPMWMVFGSGAPVSYFTSLEALSFLQGILCVVGSNGLARIDFNSDDIRFTQAGNDRSQKNISSRSAAALTDTEQTDYISSGTVNDVTMKILQDAPINTDTNLQIPIIIIGTDSGLNIIREDGTVANSSTTNSIPNVALVGDQLFTKRGSSPLQIQQYDLSGTIDNTITSIRDYRREDTSNSYPKLAGSSNDNLFAGNDVKNMAVGYQSGLFLLSQGDVSTSSSQHNDILAKVTSNYNTGYMVGDIKGAFLSDTTEETIIGSELANSGDFSSGAGWFTFPDTNSNGSVTISGGILTITSNGGTNDIPGTGYSLSTVIGEKYTVTMDVSNNTTGMYSSIWLTFDGVNAPALPHVVEIISNDTSASPIVSGEFVATSTLSVIIIYAAEDNAGSVEIDNVRVITATDDRSPNSKSIGVVGSIIKAPVAAGAELMGFSGFGTNKYLEQFPNSDLDFGTGDFSLMAWIKYSSNSANKPIIRKTDDDNYGFILQLGYANLIRFTIRDSAGSDFLESQVILPDVWTSIICLRKDSVTQMYVNGVLVVSGNSTKNVNRPRAVCAIGKGAITNTGHDMALVRISATAPTQEQITKIYEDELQLFQENAQCTIYGDDDYVRALTHDIDTNLFHAGTGDGRSTFKGLERVSNTTRGITTAISAINGMIVEE